ncbi:MAG: bifunctional DNA-formamidopyrimidine glycosylase/DNA-(apurinic or apyrimidinic site) lyase [Victivallaceae bacterium]|nr:bifunctional DNA-formamidopyrimidine glycosylase/DNA-(apurinic or apyrimidinic site) lyase [Victivallaceae bacterium]
MPELPEAETIGRALRGALTGRRIERVEIFSPKMRTPLAPLLTARLEGRRFTGVRRRARYLVADLDDGRGLLMHFGMSGVVRLESAAVPRRKHEHVFIYLDDGRIFRFECPRRFSLLEVSDLPLDGKWPSGFAGFGVEPLSDDFCGDHLFRASRGRKTSVKSLLTDNRVVVGIGNIYSAETLFAAGIHPARCASRLTRAECGRLAECAAGILRRAIADGGTTVSDFRNVDGSEGKFALHLQVYGRAGKKCPVCGEIIRSIRQCGRSSFFCPHCQK